MSMRRYLRYQGSSKKYREDAQSRDEVLRIVEEFFGNPKKAELWMRSKNPMLGGVTPEDMINEGRAWKLLRFVKHWRSENRK